MAAIFKCDSDGICMSCKTDPSVGESVECFTCKEMFHALCAEMSQETKVGSQTMVKTFLAASTKGNFKFYCDECLTKLELSAAESESQKIINLQEKYNSMEKKMDQILKLLLSEKEEPMKKQKEVGSIWNDQEMLKKIKVPPPKAVLVIKKTDGITETSQNEILENAISSNKLPITKSYKNKSGDLTVVCETKEAREQLKSIVSSENGNIVFASPPEKCSYVTIVGLSKEFSKEKVMEMLPIQNEFIKRFTVSNNLQDHIQIRAIRPLKNNEHLFQVFATVSAELRKGFQHFNDRVTVGLNTCRVYEKEKDQLKRCYNCQLFGHYAKDCSTPTEPKCGKCSHDHRTDSCTSSEVKCINCIRMDLPSDHPANSMKCPSYVHNLNLKSKSKENNLNMSNQRAMPNR